MGESNGRRLTNNPATNSLRSILMAVMAYPSPASPQLHWNLTSICKSAPVFLLTRNSCQRLTNHRQPPSSASRRPFLLLFFFHFIFSISFFPFSFFPFHSYFIWISSFRSPWRKGRWPQSGLIRPPEGVGEGASFRSNYQLNARSGGGRTASHWNISISS